ncbi:hypothetical protein GGI15_003763 [Coemansia interrupta]|uniref:Methionyl-tRNA formyltransferase n=1 Tax=Coemansia interrupta TaxID=1126814 RepID=A0A9W8LHT8_9FUNG|nr:hypothetical protein GGI15_003763 [Coemansia interrupta]
MNLLFRRVVQIRGPWMHSRSNNTLVNLRMLQARDKNPNKHMRVLFFGNDAYSLEILKALTTSYDSDDGIVKNIRLVCPTPLYTNDRRKKVVWKSLVNEHADHFALPVSHVGNKHEMSRWDLPDRDNRYDIAVVAGFDWTLPAELASKFPLGILSVHPSLLPKLRGADPVMNAMITKFTVVGVTVCKYDFEGNDSGDILAQLPYEIPKGYRREEIYRDLGYIGGNLLVKCLEHIKPVLKAAQKQNPKFITYTREYSDKICKIEWETMTAHDIVERYRATQGKIPMYSIWRMKTIMSKVFIYDMYVADPSIPPLEKNFLKYPPGSLFFKRKVQYLEVPCIDGSRLHITRLGREGRTIMTALQFVNGYLRVSGALRMLTSPVQPKLLTPPFVYPKGYVKPELDQVYKPNESDEVYAPKYLVPLD